MEWVKNQKTQEPARFLAFLSKDEKWWSEGDSNP